MAVINPGPEPVRSDLSIMLWLAAACPFGFLMWFGLFSAIRWTVLAAWSLVIGGSVAQPLTLTTPPSIHLLLASLTS